MTKDGHTKQLEISTFEIVFINVAHIRRFMASELSNPALYAAIFWGGFVGEGGGGAIMASLISQKW